MKRKIRKNPRIYFYSKKGIVCIMKDSKVYSIETGNSIQMDIPKDTVFYTEREISAVKIILPTGKWDEINRELTEAKRKKDIKRDQILEQSAVLASEEVDVK